MDMPVQQYTYTAQSMIIIYNVSCTLLKTITMPGGQNSTLSKMHFEIFNDLKKAYYRQRVVCVRITD